MKLFIIIATIVALSSLSATAIDIEKPPPPPPPPKKPDVCNPSFTPNIKCYPSGYGDGRPPCCKAPVSLFLKGSDSRLRLPPPPPPPKDCKGGKYTEKDLKCSAPGLCEPKVGSTCYKGLGIPSCCESLGGKGCTLYSNLDCDKALPKPPTPKPDSCITSAGYTWCDTLKKCVKSWETPCPAPCITSAGYTWCDTLKKCVKSWETPCPAPCMPGAPCPSPSNGNLEDLFMEELAEFYHDDSHTEGYLQG